MCIVKGPLAVEESSSPPPPRKKEDKKQRFVLMATCIPVRCGGTFATSWLNVLVLPCGWWSRLHGLPCVQDRFGQAVAMGTDRAIITTSRFNFFSGAVYQVLAHLPMTFAPTTAHLCLSTTELAKCRVVTRN